MGLISFFFGTKLKISASFSVYSTFNFLYSVVKQMIEDDDDVVQCNKYLCYYFLVGWLLIVFTDDGQTTARLIIMIYIIISCVQSMAARLRCDFRLSLASLATIVLCTLYYCTCTCSVYCSK